MKPIILLSAGYDISPNGQNRRVLYQNYGDAVTEAGGIPLMPLDNGDNADELFELCDGLILTGGPDLDPEKFFGQKKLPECGKIDEQRDSMELKLLKRFAGSGKPIFGICRGLQIINCYYGGTLWQDLPSQLGVVHSGGHDCVHHTKFFNCSPLYDFYGEGIQTNSYHHQSIDKIADGFELAAQADDGVVEAIIHKTLPIWAVQWHPERMTGPARFMHHGPNSAPIFKHFIDSCKK